MGQEHRQAERFEVQHDVEVVRGDEQVTGLTENLSLGGAMVRAPVDPPFRMGERVQISFNLPDLRDPVRVDAQVRWVNDLDPTCAGLQFLTGLRAKETWALNRLFDRLRSGST